MSVNMEEGLQTVRRAAGGEAFPLRPLAIGGVVLPSNVFCAPLAGYTDFAFRKLCYSFGAGLCYTEMVSAKGLLYNGEGTKELLLRGEGEPPQTAVQLFGGDADILRAACESEALAPFPVIDLNMGCPVPKVYKNGEGSALLADLPRAEKIVSACAKCGKPVTVKFRIGIERGKYVAAEFAKLCEGAGAAAIAVHGRVREAYYAGEPSYAQIAAAKNAVRIPVIANGGIFSVADAVKMVRETGADGVMLARAALYDPHLFAEFYGEGRAWDIPAAIARQTEDMLPVYGERNTVVHMRKMAAFYLRGMRGAAAGRRELFACETLAQLRAQLARIFGAGAEGGTSGGTSGGTNGGTSGGNGQSGEGGSGD